MIIYTFVIVDAGGEFEPPCVAWATAEEARSAAVSYLADRLVREDEADEMLEWGEEIERRDGKYPTFTAPTKRGRYVRVWPMEIMAGEAADASEPQP
jgi:hypothetical protein